MVIYGACYSVAMDSYYQCGYQFDWHCIDLLGQYIAQLSVLEHRGCLVGNIIVYSPKWPITTRYQYQLP